MCEKLIQGKRRWSGSTDNNKIKIKREGGASVTHKVIIIVQKGGMSSRKLMH